MSIEPSNLSSIASLQRELVGACPIAQRRSDGVHDTRVPGLAADPRERTIAAAAFRLRAVALHRRAGPQAGAPRRRDLRLRPAALPGGVGDAADDRTDHRRHARQRPYLCLRITVDRRLIGELLLQADSTLHAARRQHGSRPVRGEDRCRHCSMPWCASCACSIDRTMRTCSHRSCCVRSTTARSAASSGSACANCASSTARFNASRARSM